MPALQVHIADGSWVATVANTNIEYKFVGDNLGDQETAVQQLAAGMQDGQQAATSAIEETLEIGDTPPADVAEQIFNTTDVLMLNDDIIFSAVGDEMLWDDLELAGEALAAALLVVRRGPRPDMVQERRRQKKQKPAGTAAAPAPEDSTAAISVTFTNYSSTQFNLGAWGYELEYGFGSLNQSPGPYLDANDGVQTMSASQILSSLDTGPYDIWLTWYDPSTGSRFGLELYVPFQMFGIGHSPYWFYSQDNDGGSSSEPSWTSMESDSSAPYKWPSSVGFNIVATPTVDHTSLSIEVLIQDLS